MMAVAVPLEKTGLGSNLKLRGEGKRGGEEFRVETTSDMNDTRFT